MWPGERKAIEIGVDGLLQALLNHNVLIQNLKFSFYTILTVCFFRAVLYLISFINILKGNFKEMSVVLYPCWDSLPLNPFATCFPSPVNLSFMHCTVKGLCLKSWKSKWSSVCHLVIYWHKALNANCSRLLVASLRRNFRHNFHLILVGAWMILLLKESRRISF